jgi:branched-chain amino acid transport system substrate-binding protein
MAQSLLGLKIANDKAAKAGAKPTADQIAAAFKGIEFEGPAGHVKMMLGDGHQGITETAYGTYRFNKQKKEPEIVDIIRYPAECVNPPAGVEAEAWIKDGMKGAKCN